MPCVVDGTPNPEKSPKENAPKRRLYQTPAFKKGLFIFLVLASVLAFAIAVFRLDTILAVIDRIIRLYHADFFFTASPWRIC